MNVIGIAIIIVGALVIAYAYRLVGDAREGVGGSLVTAAGAALGAFAASEWLGSLSTLGPDVDGLYVLPALVGGLIVGAALEAVARQTTRPEPTQHPAH